MTLTEWIDALPLAWSSRTAVHHYLAEELEKVGKPITWQTIASIDRGMKLSRNTSEARAEALSKLTKGAVTVAELCE